MDVVEFKDDNINEFSKTPVDNVTNTYTVGSSDTTKLEGTVTLPSYIQGNSVTLLTDKTEINPTPSCYICEHKDVCKYYDTLKNVIGVSDFDSSELKINGIPDDFLQVEISFKCKKYKYRVLPEINGYAWIANTDPAVLYSNICTNPNPLNTSALRTSIADYVELRMSSNN